MTQIEKAMDAGGIPGELLIEAFNIPMKRSDIWTLRHGEWLNDEVLDLMLCCLGIAVLTDLSTFAFIGHQLLLRAHERTIRKQPTEIPKSACV